MCSYLQLTDIVELDKDWSDNIILFRLIMDYGSCADLISEVTTGKYGYFL